MKGGLLFPDRIANARARLEADNLAGCILFYSRDVLYYTGTAQPAWLILRPDDYRLFVRSGMEFTARESWLPPDRITRERSLSAAAREMFPGEGRGRDIGTELDLLPVLQAPVFQKAVGGRRLVDFSPAVLEQRGIKAEEEVEVIREACAAAAAGHEAAVEFLSSNAEKTELALAAAVENAHRLAGHEGLFFMRQADFVMGRGPLASGPNLREISGVVFTITGRGLSAAVPAGASRRPLKRGELILIDIPTCIKGYHADQTRMYCLGRPPHHAVDLYDRLLELADGLLESIRPGLTCDQVYGMARREAGRLGIEDSLLRFPTGIQAHFVGHGLGLELNEPPLIAGGRSDELMANMVLALELHVMDRDGITLKLEDTFLLSETGCRLLTSSPRGLTVV
jgi:Xaa-Pro dipeptidase